MYIIHFPQRLLRRGALFLAVMVVTMIVAYLLTPPVIERNQDQPVAAAKLLPLMQVSTREPALALTFDISWGEAMPPKVLAVLREHGVTCTFFLSGPWARRHPEIVRQIVTDGHDIQSHGQEHKDYSTLTKAQLIQNIRESQEILEALTGRLPTYVRPPNGDYDDKSIIAAGEIGVTLVTWSVDTLDWMNPGVQRIKERALRLAHKGAIVLLHASDSCKQTDLALPDIIKGLRDQGYQLVTLPELVEMETK
ncbi:MAG: polysaccharide deacetylase family protein [Bacillota bacterium]